MPRCWRRDRSRRACPASSPMHTTWVVSAMTPTHRVKAPARRRPSTLIRGPVSCQGTGPFVLPPPGLPRRRCARAAPALSQLASIARRLHGWRAFNTGRRRGSSSAALPHLGCAHAQASAGLVCMCARAAACRVQRRVTGLRRPVASRVDTAEMALLPRWTSGEVLGPSSRRGGFDSRTGYQLFTEAPRRAHASRGANRPQRLGGVGTRHRQPSSLRV